MRRVASYARSAVATPTSSMLTRLSVAAFAVALSSSSSNSGMPEAARVASRPGDGAHADALGAELGRQIAHRASSAALATPEPPRPGSGLSSLALPCGEAFGYPVCRQRTVFVADVEADMIAVGIHD